MRRSCRPPSHPRGSHGVRVCLLQRTRILPHRLEARQTVTRLGGQNKLNSLREKKIDACGVRLCKWDTFKSAWWIIFNNASINVSNKYFYQLFYQLFLPPN